MSDQQRQQPPAPPPAINLGPLTDKLRSLGYDIEPPRTGDPPDSNIVARRDLGDRVILFVADRGGRFRIDISWVVGEWPSSSEIATVPVRVVDRVTRAVYVVGQAGDTEQLANVAAGLGSIVSWASEPPRDSKPSTETPPPP